MQRLLAVFNGSHYVNVYTKKNGTATAGCVRKYFTTAMTGCQQILIPCSRVVLFLYLHLLLLLSGHPIIVSLKSVKSEIYILHLTLG